MIVSGGEVIRGSHIGAGPAGDAQRGAGAARLSVSYYCSNGHRTRPAFAADAQAPESWECVRCGLPAGLDPAQPPSARSTEPYKSHLAYVKERRTDSEAAEILTEALTILRDRRARGDIIY